MNILIKESQMNLIMENVEGLDTFKTKTFEYFPEIEDYWDVIDEFIRNSECKKIEIKNIKYGIAVSLVDGVIFSESTFKQPLPLFLFTIFHEIAHQYQFKKYGNDKMMELYLDKISIEDAAKAMQQIELVADEFATRKLRELQKLGYLTNINIPEGFYKKFPLSQFEKIVGTLKSQVSSLGIEDINEISKVLYNWIKTKS